MRLEEVWFRYGRRTPWALREVSASLDPGQLVVVRGHNGAGKSTLLQLMAGVLRPTRGTIRDRPASVGWVPERFPADQPHSVHGYLTAMGAVRGLSGSARARAVDHWIDRLGLGHYTGVKLPELSKGTAQKVGLAQALLVAPGLLVLDEPWEGLDGQTRDLVPDLIAEVLAAGGSVLLSDHRGETARLRQAIQWTIAAGRLEGVDAEAEAWCVIEITVAVPESSATVARLRADGHQVVRVRQP